MAVDPLHRLMHPSCQCDDCYAAWQEREEEVAYKAWMDARLVDFVVEDPDA